MLKALIGERFKQILAIEFSTIMFKYFIHFISIIIFILRPNQNLI